MTRGMKFMLKPYLEITHIIDGELVLEYSSTQTVTERASRTYVLY